MNDRNKALSSIFAQFEGSAHAFCENTGGMFCEIQNQYKGAEQPGNLKRKTAKIYYHAFAVEFLYLAHGPLGAVNSILSCAVYLDKVEDSLGIPLPLMTDYCAMEVQEPLCIPFISNAQAMQQAFACVGGVMKRLHPILTEKYWDAQLLTQIQRAYYDELRRVLKIDPNDLQGWQRYGLADFFASWFSRDAFQAAVGGNYQKAVKKLKQTKVLTGYELRMQQIWLSKKTPVENPAASRNVKGRNGYGASRLENREVLLFLVGMAVLTPVFSVGYAGLYTLLIWIAGWNSVYLIGPVYQYPFCIVAGIFTAIVTCWFARFFFFRIIFPKQYTQYCETESIQNTNGFDKFFKGLFVLIVTACVACCVLLVNRNLNFKEDGFTDNTEFYSLAGTYYAYEEVEYIYFKPDRVNGLGETLPYPSFVLVLEDGREIDFYGLGRTSDYSDELLEFFRAKGIEIR